MISFVGKAVVPFNCEYLETEELSYSAFIDIRSGRGPSFVGKGMGFTPVCWRREGVFISPK